MPTLLAATPLLFDPSMEAPEPEEAETEHKIIKDILKICETTYKHSGHATRAVHAKSHGIVKGELVVPDGLPAVLAQGLFSRAGRHDVILRFSTSPGDILDDSVSTPRGLAIKVFGVEGDRLPGSDGASTQDFVLVMGKTFNAENAKSFSTTLGLLVATTDKAEGLKKVLSAALRGAEKLIEATGGESALLKGLGGQPETHILGESFFSQVPIRYGDYIAKVGVRPTSPELAALTDAPLKLNGVPNGLRAAVKDFFSGKAGEWEFVVQLAVGDDMPIENAAKVWPEDQSPYLPVATLVVPPQDSWSEASQPKINDALAFTPWHGLAAHQPLGSIMRLRKGVYAASQNFRLPKNGCPMVEPASAAAITG